jgi:hypothetical protein
MGRISADSYDRQIIFKVEGTGTVKNSYFIFNLANDASTYPVTYTATSLSDFILSGPFNLSKAKFGRGFITYEIDGTKDMVYLSMDVLKLTNGINYQVDACPVLTPPTDIKKIFLRNCLDF